LADCACSSPLTFSSTNAIAISKHNDTFGRYYLYGSYDGFPVYQHEHGSQYIYQYDGYWYISEFAGSSFHKWENRGDAENAGPCLARSRVAWTYVDASKSWPYVADSSAKFTCPSDGCSLNKCGFNAICTERVFGSARCICKNNYVGNPYQRCFPDKRFLSEDCTCQELIVSSTGSALEYHAIKMGTYYLTDFYLGRPAYQHKNGLNYLFYHNSKPSGWYVGGVLNGPDAGLANFDNATCPYKIASTWYHTRNTPDDSIQVKCNDVGQVTSISGEEDYKITSAQFCCSLQIVVLAV